jgi:hypothetical protein
MIENGGNVHDGTQAILRVIQADMAGVKGDIAELKQRLGGVENRFGSVEHRFGSIENRLEGLEQGQRATFDLMESVGKSVTTMSRTVEAALDKVLKSHQLMGPRLNSIEGRLAALEEHTGMFRA